MMQRMIVARVDAHLNPRVSTVKAIVSPTMIASILGWYVEMIIVQMLIIFQLCNFHSIICLVHSSAQITVVTKIVGLMQNVIQINLDVRVMMIVLMVFIVTKMIITAEISMNVISIMEK